MLNLKKCIEKIGVKNIIIILLSMVVTVKSMDYSLLYNFLRLIPYQIIILVSCLSIFLLQENRKIKKNIITFIVLLISIIVSGIIRGKIGNLCLDIMMCISLFLVFNFNIQTFKHFAIGSSIGVLPYLVYWVLKILITGEYLGNRGPVNFIFVLFMFLIVICWNNKNRYKYRYEYEYKYGILILLILVCFISKSRTSLIASSIVLFLMMVKDYKIFIQLIRNVKIKNKQMSNKNKIIYILCTLVILSIVVFVIYKVFNLILFKAGKDTFHSTVARTRMWKDVLSNLKWWGFESDYLIKKYKLMNIHNSFLQAYVSYGILVAIINIVWITNIFMKAIIAHKHKDMYPLLIVYIAFLVFSFFESAFILDPMYPLLGLCFVAISGQIQHVFYEYKKRKDVVCQEEEN